MTQTALTAAGQRDRIIEKLAQIDWRFATLVAVLGAIGSIVLYSIAGMSWKPWADQHLIRFVLLFAVMIGLSLVDLRVWFWLAYPLYGVALFLLGVVAVAGAVHMGARRWLPGPVSFQPSELMKLAIILALARWYHGCSANEARFHWRLIVPFMLILAPVLLVAKQPDLGTALMIAFTGFSVMFAAGLSWRIVGAGGLAAVIGAPIMYFFVMHDFQRERIDTFLHPETDPTGDGYHILESEIALGSGGLLGKGLGLGTQSQLDYLPEKHTDFIFAAIAEQLGLVGCVTLLALFGLTIWLAIRSASIAHSHFGRLAALGATFSYALYVLINGAMVMGLAPVVGVPMPFLSYGGSVMMIVMIGFGLIMSVRVHRYLELPAGRGQLV